MRRFYIVVLFSFFISSCLQKEEKHKIASVYGKDLLLSEIISEMPDQMEDSIYFIEKYTNSWIRRQLMVHHAEINLDKDLLTYNKQIEDYKYSLLIYAYQQQLLNYNFDTTINHEDIHAYYYQYKDELKLQKDIVKGRFIVVNKQAPNLYLLNEWFKSEDNLIKEELFDYCQQFAKEYYLDEGKWQYFSVFTNKLPDDKKGLSLNKKSVWFEDDNFRYYLFIKDFELKGSISPLSLQRDKIKGLLLNRNKINYLKKVEDELYENGLDLEKIKIY